MATTKGYHTPEIWNVYKKRAENKDKNVRLGFLERNEFYNRSKNAYAIVASSEEAIYANIILKKGAIK